MKCPLLKTKRNEIDTNGMIKQVEEFQECVGTECWAYVPELKEHRGVPGCSDEITQFEDCRMMRR